MAGALEGILSANGLAGTAAALLSADVGAGGIGDITPICRGEEGAVGSLHRCDVRSARESYLPLSQIEPPTNNPPAAASSLYCPSTPRVLLDASSCLTPSAILQLAARHAGLFEGIIVESGLMDIKTLPMVRVSRGLSIKCVCKNARLSAHQIQMCVCTLSDLSMVAGRLLRCQ